MIDIGDISPCIGHPQNDSREKELKEEADEGVDAPTPALPVLGRKTKCWDRVCENVKLLPMFVINAMCQVLAVQGDVSYLVAGKYCLPTQTGLLTLQL